MSNGAARKRARNRKAQRRLEATRELAQAINQRPARHGRHYDQLADPSWNRHVVFWEAGTLEANLDADEEDDGWVSLTRGDGRSMWYNPTTRRAYWTGFDPRTEFFIKDIEAYIKQKFYS